MHAASLAEEYIAGTLEFIDVVMANTGPVRPSSERVMHGMHCWKWSSVVYGDGASRPNSSHARQAAVVYERGVESSEKRQRVSMTLAPGRRSRGRSAVVLQEWREREAAT